MRAILNKIQKNKKTILAVILACFVLWMLIEVKAGMATDVTIGSVASGSVGAAVAILVGWLTSILSAIVGLILTLLIRILVNVAQFNKIIGVEAVETGWVIVRDLCNMFFILILLVIAFATILRIESYNAKKLLPKLLIMAVLINFSRTICGLIIDFAQVIMLTFVNGFSQNGAGNFINLFNVQNYQNIVVSIKEKEVSNFSVAGAFIAGLIAMIITTIVVAVMLAVLVMRVVMLWVYTILSPLAFLLSAFPAGQKYSQQWWSEFSKNVIVGPVLAFFIWLALSTASTSSNSLGKFAGAGANTGGELCAGINKFFCEGSLQTYIITIALLIGGLMVTQQIGGIAGGIAGKGMAAIQKGKGLATGGALKLGKNIGGWAVDKASLAVGADLNVVRGYKRLKAQMEINKESREAKIYGKAVETADKGGFFRSKLAHISTGDLAWESVRNWYKPAVAKRFFMGGKAFNEKKEKLSKEEEILKKERTGVLTKKERSQKVGELYNMRDESKRLAGEVLTQRMAVQTAPKDKIDEENKKLQSLQNQKKDIDDGIKLKEQELRTKVDDKEAARIDKAIELKQDEHKGLDKLEISGLAAARAQSMSELESKEGKLIAHIDNSEQLGMMFEDAIRNQRPGLAAAIAKKMTKNYDYNELLAKLGLGTGLKGMTELAKVMQKSGMSEQSALGVIGDMGAVAKGLGHYGAFGAVTMEKGRFRPANEEEYETAQLAEMLKLQPQNFGRNVNRLGLGYYDPAPGETHSMKNWKLSKAATAYIKLNGAALASNWLSTGQQNALEHVYNNIDQLKANDVPQEIIDTLEKRTKQSKGRGADPLSTIRSIKG